MSKSITSKNDIMDEVMEETESMSDVDDVDLCFILTLLYAIVQELTSSYFVQSELNSPKQQDQSACKYYKRKRLGLARRVYPQWSEIKLDTSDSIFCRKFQMSKETFQDLCSTVDNDFKPESTCPPHHVCGEVRVAVGL
jgi:hypothetical protein